MTKLKAWKTMFITWTNFKEKDKIEKENVFLQRLSHNS